VPLTWPRSSVIDRHWPALSGIAQRHTTPTIGHRHAPDSRVMRRSPKSNTAKRHALNVGGSSLVSTLAIRSSHAAASPSPRTVDRAGDRGSSRTAQTTMRWRFFSKAAPATEQPIEQPRDRPTDGPSHTSADTVRRGDSTGGCPAGDSSCVGLGFDSPRRLRGRLPGGHRSSLRGA
jgi:hypothetical protein